MKQGENILKSEILNHRVYLTNLIVDDADTKESEIESKKSKIESINPSECLRNELSMPISFDCESLQIRSNFDTSDESSSVSISSQSSCASSPCCDGSQTPIEIEIDQISLSYKLAETFNLNKSSYFPLNSNLLKYNLNHLNLIKKDTLIFLIEKNLSNNIKCPFDIFAYNRLVNSQAPKANMKNIYNCLNVKKNSKFLSYYKSPLHKKFLRENNLLPCSVGMFLMPLYFDIFKISEVNQFSQMEIDMMLLLKRTYSTQIYLDYESLISNYKENILWNCFVLFKYRINDILKDNNESKNMRMEIFNYYLALVYTLQHLEYVVHFIQINSKISNKILKDHISKALDLSRALPNLFETLLLTGLFSQNDFIEYEKFALNKLDSIMITDEYNLEKAYYENSLNSIKQTCEKVFPLKLTNLCRIVIKNSMKSYDATHISKLAVPKDIKKFLLYENELASYYVKYKNSSFTFIHKN